MSYVPGLEGVVAGQTSISHVEGEKGRLSYRGHLIQDIVKMDYLSVAYLVLFGESPTGTELSRFKDYFVAHGELSEDEKRLLQALPGTLHPMEALQAMIPLITFSDELFNDESSEVSRGLQIIARYPALLSGIHAVLTDQKIPEESPSLEYLDKYLFLLNGEALGEHQIEIFKTVQLLQMDHSFNAGTFAGRVIGSTLADVAAVISGAVGALSGRLHGGADEAALRSARSLDSPDNALEFVDEILANKRRLMGMGHREYRVVDPRSTILKPMAASLAEGTPYELDFRKLEAIEMAFNQRMAERGKEVWANLEFYKGVVYECLGVRPTMFTATFAMSRSVGWLAHFRESRNDNRIIRPAAEYVGRLPA